MLIDQPDAIVLHCLAIVISQVARITRGTRSISQSGDALPQGSPVRAFSRMSREKLILVHGLVSRGNEIFHWFADEHTLHRSVGVRMGKNERTRPDITGRASRNLLLLADRLILFQSTR